MPRKAECSGKQRDHDSPTPAVGPSRSPSVARASTHLGIAHEFVWGLAIACLVDTIRDGRCHIARAAPAPARTYAVRVAPTAAAAVITTPAAATAAVINARRPAVAPL